MNIFWGKDTQSFLYLKRQLLISFCSVKKAWKYHLALQDLLLCTELSLSYYIIVADFYRVLNLHSYVKNNFELFLLLCKNKSWECRKTHSSNIIFILSLMVAGMN